MNKLKKTIAAVSSLVLAFALMVPAVSWADDDSELELRLSYDGQPVVMSELPSVPHSISVTFGVSADYPAYSGKVTSSFKLSDGLASGRMRVASGPIQNPDGSFTVVLSDGNGVLPLTDQRYLDLGSLDVKVDGTLDLSASDAEEMTKATISITALEISDASFRTTNIVGDGAESSRLEVPLTLSRASFSDVVSAGSGGTLPDDKPTVDKPEVNVPGDMTGPSSGEVNDAASGVAIPALWSIWNGEQATGVSADGQATIKAFLDRVRAAGYDFSDLEVKYSVDVKKYSGVDDVPQGDMALLDAAFGDGYYELGYYDLKVTMAVSVPADASLGTASAAIEELSAPLSFTVDVASGSLEGKAVSVGYVHNSKLGVIADGINVDVVAGKVTFPATMFSTYGVYASNDSVGKVAPSSSPVAAGLASTGDDARNPIMLLVGAAVLCGALVAVFARPRNRSQA